MATDGPMKRTSSLVKRQNNEEEDRAIRTRLTAGISEEESASLPPPYPQTGEGESSAYKPGRFKAVSQLVLAMNRFKASLNPTYTFGKRSDSGNSLANDWVKDTPDSNANDVDSLSPAQNDNLEPQKVYTNRGHKTNYLLRPLPPAANEGQIAS